MFGLFKKKVKPLTDAEEVRRIELEYLRMTSPQPASTPELPAVDSERERFFAIQNDILRYNIARSGGAVPNMGNDFD